MSKIVKYQQIHVLQPNLKQGVEFILQSASNFCHHEAIFLSTFSGGEGGTIPGQATPTVWGSLPLINGVSKEGATSRIHSAQQLEKGEQRGGTFLQVTILFIHTWASHRIILAVFGSNYSSNTIPFGFMLTIYGGT